MRHILFVFFMSTIFIYSQDSTMPPGMHMDHKRIMMHPSDVEMHRHSSGTSWLPDNSPMYGYMVKSGSWTYMLHGNIFIRYNNQDITKKNNRGAAMFDAPNWFMGTAESKIGRSGKFQFSLMLSLDPLTIGGEGYPLLFQSGESWHDKPLVDRQHPHDLFSELAISYTYSIYKRLAFQVYFGYPGEPALGPPAFMHRTSALNNPDAPIGHHWEDATHITFGVGTLGIIWRNYKIEGSVFTGREPNENRYNFDKPKFDSYSLRLSANPSKEVAVEVSHGFLLSPEALNPEENIRKTVASVIYNEEVSREKYLSTSFVWGLNDNLHQHKEHAVLLESNLALKKMNFYGRYEWVQKSGYELQLSEQLFGNVYSISLFTLGTNYSLLKLSGINVNLGIQASIFFPDKSLVNFYGKNPLSLEAYLRISPQLMMMK